jgi:hypothetical protein
VSDAEVRRSRVRQAHVYLASVGPLWRHATLQAMPSETDSLAVQLVRVFYEATGRGTAMRFVRLRTMRFC